MTSLPGERRAMGSSVLPTLLWLFAVGVAVGVLLAMA
jgi:hypothetical protein